MTAVANRLASRGIFLGHCHDGGFSLGIRIGTASCNDRGLPKRLLDGDTLASPRGTDQPILTPMLSKNFVGFSPPIRAKT
jgi:hypothetical protein